MGYYTQYRLEAKNIKTPEEFETIRNFLKGLDLLNYAFDKGDYYEFEQLACFAPGEETKWYDHNDDMRELSTRLPNATFMLEGDGENSADFWREYYKDGEWERCDGYVIYSDPVKISW